MFRIKEILKNKGIKIGDFAVKLDMHQSNLSAIINNRTTPSLDMLQKIADALNVSIVELFEEFKPKPIRKDTYYGSTRREKGFNGDIFHVGDMFEKYELSISDAEITDNLDSPEVAMFSLSGYDDNGEDTKREIFVHKKDLLELSLFCLELHQQYVSRKDAIAWEDFTARFGSYNTDSNKRLISHKDSVYEINSIEDLKKLIAAIEKV